MQAARDAKRETLGCTTKARRHKTFLFLRISKGWAVVQPEQEGMSLSVGQAIVYQPSTNKRMLRARIRLFVPIR